MNAPPDDLPNFPDPPIPSTADWQRVREAVRHRTVPRRAWLKRSVLVAGAIAASLAVGVLCWPTKVDQQSSQARQHSRPVDWLAEFDVLPIATSTHFMVTTLNGPNDDTLLTVEHPLKARMSLATESDTIMTKIPNGEANRMFLDTTEVK